MKIALVGAGNVATCMGPRLKAAGHDIVCVYSRTMQSASVLAERLGAVAVTDLAAMPQADVYLTMLKDDALLALAPDIVKGRDGLFLHTAGSIPMSVWSDAGASNCGVLYVMQTFSKTSVIEWDKVTAFIEGTSDSIRELASDLTPNVVSLSSEGRRRLHLAAVFANNFSNHMFAVSQRLLEKEGVPFSVMLPLIREGVRKLDTMNPSDAQTGPAVRGDRQTMNSHVRLLAGNPQLQELYTLITDIIQQKTSGK